MRRCPSEAIGQPAEYLRLIRHALVFADAAQASASGEFGTNPIREFVTENGRAWHGDPRIRPRCSALYRRGDLLRGCGSLRPNLRLEGRFLRVIVVEYRRY